MKERARVYLALVHYPVYNKRMQTITTSVTNLDLHDISRAARTYEADGFFVVHPVPAQVALIEQIRSFWQEGYGAEYNPDRREAFSLMRVVSDLREATHQIQAETGAYPLVAATDARVYPNTVTYRELRERIKTGERPVLVVFGTGFGWVKEEMEKCDLILEPIMAGSSYNHLSVRSAVAIILDRLLGEDWFAG